MKHALFAMMAALLAAGSAAAPIEYVAPEFLQPAYDCYTVNYLNAMATGRGHTGVSDLGGVENSVLNPAAFVVRNPDMYLEMNIKTNIDMINQVEDQNITGTPSFTSPWAFPYLAFGFSPLKNSSFALSYSQPQSIRYDRFSIMLHTGATADRFPTLIDHRFTFGGNTAFNNLRVGVNVMGDLIIQHDYRNYYTLDRIDTSDFLVRVQPGLHYQAGAVGIGFTDLLPVSHKFDMDYGEVYDITLPNIAGLGLSCAFGSWKALAEAQFEQWSTLSDEMNDRLRLNLGGEWARDKVTYRFGVMSVPEVFSGEYVLPAKPDTTGVTSRDTTPGGNINSDYFPTSDTGTIKSNGQFIVTGGWTRRFDGGQFSAAVAFDVMGDVQIAQIQAGLSVDFARIGKALKSQPRDVDLDN